eukprot:scaffold142362_cov50-Prasinocladus_malaysianus.AAC.1
MVTQRESHLSDRVAAAIIAAYAARLHMRQPARCAQGRPSLLASARHRWQVSPAQHRSSCGAIHNQIIDAAGRQTSSFSPERSSKISTIA